MTVANASNTPQYSGGFIPERWASKLNAKFYSTTVFGEIANTDYEGEITSMGDKVEIRIRPDINVFDYEKNQELPVQLPESNKITLAIDRAQGFNVRLDDVDATQSDLDLMTEFTEDASEQMQIRIDSTILGEIYADADSANAGPGAGKQSESINLGETGSPVTVNKENIVDFIVDMGTVLDEQDIPQSDRWLILPPSIVGRIKKSELKDASLAGDGTSILRNGRVGMVDRFTVYSSNNLSSVTDSGDKVWNCVFGHPQGLTYASQIAKIERRESERYFGEFVRGLNVYGFKVTNPEAMGHFYAKLGT